MLRQRHSYTAVEPQTRAALSGLALVAVLLAVLVGFGAGPAPAVANPLEPCETTDPTGPVVEREGELSLEPTGKSRRVLKRSRLRQSLIRPANRLAGRPAFPVGAVRYAATARVNLRGGFRIHHRKRRVAFRGLQLVSAPGKPAVLKGRIGKRTLNVLRVPGGKRSFDAESGELTRYGTARLTPAAAKLINRRLKTGKRRLRAGSIFGFLNLYSLYKVTQPAEDPSGDAPVPAPVKAMPTGAGTIQTAANIKWYVRDTFIDYVSAGTWNGDGIDPLGGASADAPSGPKNLVYSFNFPFDSGWTVPATSGTPEPTPENTLIKGQGGVGFRYCMNTINFTVSDPEIELDGEDSRLIFRVNGTDGTAFPNERAVMVKLLPEEAETVVVDDNGGNGPVTVTYEKIPGFIPAEATGIFAGFYPAFDPEQFGSMNPRPDRFGFVSVTYSYNPGGNGE